MVTMEATCVRTIWNASNPVSCFSLLGSVLRSNNLVARYSIFYLQRLKKKRVVNPSTVKRCLHVLLLTVMECDSLAVRQVFGSCQLSSRLAALLLFQLFKKKKKASRSGTRMLCVHTINPHSLT